MIRDQALAVSGLMAEMFGGPPVKPYHPAGLYEQIVYQGASPISRAAGRTSIAAAFTRTGNGRCRTRPCSPSTPHFARPASFAALARRRPCKPST